MARLINADALIENYELHIVIGAGDNICIDIADIAKAPTVDAVPVVHGRWVNASGCRTICNNCFEYPLYDYFGRLKLSNYCPNCGARMDLEVE